MNPTERKKVIDRIQSMITQVNETNMASKNQNYLRGGKSKLKKYRTDEIPPFQIMGDDGQIRIYSQPDSLGYMKGNGLSNMPIGTAGYIPTGGYMPNQYIPVGGYIPNQYIPVGGNYVGGAKKRKPRKDKGKKRQPSEWLKFVRVIQKSEGLSYRDALKQASSLKKNGYTIEDFM